MLPAPADAIALDLAALLRNGTRDLHRAAERSAMMRRLLAGDIDRVAYCRLLRNLHAIYQRLEPALDRHAAAEPVSRVHFPELQRTVSLAADLAVLHGHDWAQAIPLTATAGSYVGRLQYLDDCDPSLLVAHSYVRYLGDLNGGQLLCRIVIDALDLRDGVGTAFYRFGPPDATVLAARYRQGLSQLRLSEAVTTRVLDEARAAFRWHCAMFDELG